MDPRDGNDDAADDQSDNDNDFFEGDDLVLDAIAFYQAAELDSDIARDHPEALENAEHD